MAEIGAHKSETSNFEKLNCKINNKIMGYLLDLITTNSFMTLHAAKQLGSRPN
jgi:hypothetical protein